jgi:hypothetical protein
MSALRHPLTKVIVLASLAWAVVIVVILLIVTWLGL